MFKLTLIACGNKMPSWVECAVNDYSKRLKEFIHFSLVEIPLIKRTKTSDLARLLDKESSTLLAAIPEQSYVIGLDSKGKSFTSDALASTFEKMQQHHSHASLLIGGPEGFLGKTRERCDTMWSLSALTLSHPLVRVVTLEAIYRAWAIINNHPYHK